jgi:hypothetical protein
MSTATPHLDDGALVRILDRQPFRHDDTVHLEGCDQCMARYRVIERRSRAFRGIMDRAASAEPAPPPDLLERARAEARATAGGRSRRIGTPMGRAAAMVALLLAGALAAEPVRDWVTETARDLAVTLGLADRPAPPVLGAGVEVTIDPVGDTLVLRFDTPEPGGLARITFHDRSEASGQAPDDPSAPGLVALPDGFRIRNTDAAGTRYRFTAPADLLVEVRVADQVIATLRGEPGEEVEVGIRDR